MGPLQPLAFRRGSSHHSSLFGCLVLLLITSRGSSGHRRPMSAFTPLCTALAVHSSQTGGETESHHDHGLWWTVCARAVDSLSCCLVTWGWAEGVFRASASQSLRMQPPQKEDALHSSGQTPLAGEAAARGVEARSSPPDKGSLRWSSGTSPEERNHCCLGSPAMGWSVRLQ